MYVKPIPITFLDFCGVAKIVYRPAVTTIAGFVQYSPTDRRLSGFQGAIYRRPGATGFDWVIGIAGTQPKEDLGADLVADAGFGGVTGGAAGSLASNLLLGPLAALGAVGSTALATAGTVLLEQQCRAAGELITAARRVMGNGDRLFVTGHSLGGGICQIVAARYGVMAVCFNPPSVTAVAGVEIAYALTKPAITSLQVRNDPINRTSAVGRWLGKVVPLPSARTGMDAHSIDLTHGELGPSGPFTAIGASDPFI